MKYNTAIKKLKHIAAFALKGLVILFFIYCGLCTLFVIGVGIAANVIGNEPSVKLWDALMGI